MHSLPRPPDTLSLPAKVKMRSDLFEPVMRSPCAVPRIATWRPKRLLRHGLVALTPLTSPSGTTVPPLLAPAGGPTTTVRMQASPSLVVSGGQVPPLAVASRMTQTPRDGSYTA